MIYSALLMCAGLASQALAACDRAKLQEATAAYIKAQVDGKADASAWASDVKYIENDETMDVAKGVLSQAVSADFNLTFYDTTDCASFVALTSVGSHPYVIHTRLGMDPESKITSIDSVVTDAGDWAFNAQAHLRASKAEDWSAIPEDKRDARDVIKKAGDLYLDNWGDTTIKVPLGTPCARLEGGLYTGQSNPNGNTCGMPAFPVPLKVANRRYVIDEEYGVVGMLNGFPFLEKSKGNDGSTPSSNLFRVQGGLIRYIHEVTQCATRNCGR